MNTNRLWYAPHTKIASSDTIHQVLMFGTLSDIKSLKKTIGEAKIKEIFLRSPKKVYTSMTLNFVKNFILDIQTSVDEQKYLKTTPRIIG